MMCVVSNGQRRRTFSERHATLLFGILSLFASPNGIARDTPGSADHPLLTRYPAAEIRGFRKFDYEEYKLATAADAKGKLQTQIFRGRATTIIYQIEGDQTAIQVFRNYEQAVQQAGMKILLSCFNEKCERTLPVTVFRGSSREDIYRTMRYDSMHPGNADLGYISATGLYNGAPVAVGIYVGRLRTSKRTDVGVDIVESEPMKSGLVTISAESLQKDIAAKGKAVLDGVFFDTDKATIKPESSAALAAIAEYLKRNASTYFVVGHTDTVGSYEHNLDLAKRRAQAIADELARAHGIVMKRLTAVGIGPVAPLESNEAESGRARNRRVELVLQAK